jgi:hypothetical protein
VARLEAAPKILGRHVQETDKKSILEGLDSRDNGSPSRSDLLETGAS